MFGDNELGHNFCFNLMSLVAPVKIIRIKKQLRGKRKLTSILEKKQFLSSDVDFIQLSRVGWTRHHGLTAADTGCFSLCGFMGT